MGWQRLLYLCIDSECHCNRAETLIARPNKRLRRDPLKLVGECRILFAEVIDPDRRIRKNHLALGRRRGMKAMAGDFPPNSASLLEASLSINALSASRIKALFSTKPVYSCAVLMRWSSTAIVVRKDVSCINNGIV